MTLHGTLYEVTNFASFVRTYVMDSRRPDPESVCPLKNGWVRLCRGDGSNAGSPLPPPCRTDDTGYFELDLSQVPDAPVFVAAGGSEKLRESCWYRSACVQPVALDQHAQAIYVAHATIPDESGFSQTDLTDLLEQTKKQVSDLERITGTITPGGIVLSCTGKGGTASGRLVLTPDQSGDLKRILCHAVEDFRLELPGPSWLVGLLVSRSVIETSIRNGLRDLAREIDAHLRLRATALFTEQIRNKDQALADRLAGESTLTFSRLHDAPTSSGVASQASRTITGEACLGFPRTLESRDSQL